MWNLLLSGALAEEAEASAEAVEAAVESSPSYLTDTVFKKLINADVSFWLMLVGLAALFAIFLPAGIFESFFLIYRIVLAWKDNL